MCTRSDVFVSILFLSSVVCTEPASSQSPPIAWGKISRADLAMKAYPSDTNAAALVLCDYGVQSISDDLGLTFSRHLRIKILSKEGFGWGTHVISLYTKERQEQIHDLEGVTYSLGADSSIVATGLQPDAVFMEKASAEWTRWRFTLPGLLPGCILDIRYRITSTNLFDTRDWQFQTSIPTLWSEFRFIAPRYFAFGGVVRGGGKFFLAERSERNQHFGGKAAAYMGGAVSLCHQYRWVLKEVPALRAEPYVANINDYVPGVSMQLAGYALPKGGSRPILKTWRHAVQELLDHVNFGERCLATGSIRSVTERLTSGLTMPEKKISLIYDFVKNTIVWDGRQRIFAERDLDEVLELRKGNSAEMAFLLLAMLREAGIESAPVLVSTRSNGRVQTAYPILSQFNHVLVQVRTDSSTMFLDPLDPLRPASLLPAEVLNVRGLLIKEGAVEWVDIVPTRNSIHHARARISLLPGGELDGVLECQDDGYSALALRNELREKSTEEVAKGLLETDSNSLLLDSVTVSGKDSITVPLKLAARVRSSTYAQAFGDIIVLNPQIIDRIAMNPFAPAVRKFPLDLEFCRDYSTSVTLTIPDGFDVKEYPPDVTVDIGSPDATFSRHVIVEGNQIHMNVRYSTARAEFPASMYRRLSDFFGLMVAKESDQLVLQRHIGRATGSGPPSPAAAPGLGAAIPPEQQ